MTFSRKFYGLERDNMRVFEKSFFSKAIFGILVILVCATSTIAFAEEINDVHTIKLIQATLNNEGFECGSVDGIVGNQTRDAVEEFQRRKDLEVTGLINEELIDALDITEEMLRGVLYEDFVQRYNEATNILNDISTQTGKPTIQQIEKEDIIDEAFVLDKTTTFQVAADERKISILGVSLYRETNEYDISMVYELVATSYGMDEGFTNVDEAIEFVGKFIDEKSAATERMNYGMWNHEGTMYITVIEAL